MDNLPTGYIEESSMDEIERTPYEEGIGQKCEYCDAVMDFVTYKDELSHKWYTHECTNSDCNHATDPEPMDDDDYVEEDYLD